MKKALVIVLSAMLALCLFACAGGGDASSTKKPEGGTKPTEVIDNGKTAAPGEDDPAATDEPGPGDTAPTQENKEPVAGSEGLSGTVDDGEYIITGIGDCTLTDIVIPSHVNGIPVKKIDEDAFAETGITSVVIPWTVRTIDEGAFAGCTSLKSVTFDEGLVYIDDSAFYGCSSLEGDITFPSTLSSLGSSSFRFCPKITSLKFLGFTTVGNNAFDECSALRSVEISPVNDSGEFDRYAIGGNAFTNCKALETLTLKGKLTEIGSWAFADCDSLKTVYLISTYLERIRACAFLRTGVEKVYYKGSEDQWKAIKIDGSNDQLTGAAIEYNYA